MLTCKGVVRYKFSSRIMKKAIKEIEKFIGKINERAFLVKLFMLF